eukprot:Lithocolla_globosa_v1_NODE_1954_length_2242_cov_6.186100.p3 type:complete len:164 gc:universal NODE_1954_length_2242_cov_6.186100:913-422(-)
MRLLGLWLPIFCLFCVEKSMNKSMFAPKEVDEYNFLPALPPFPDDVEGENPFLPPLFSPKDVQIDTSIMHPLPVDVQDDLHNDLTWLQGGETRPLDEPEPKKKWGVDNAEEIVLSTAAPVGIEIYKHLKERFALFARIVSSKSPLTTSMIKIWPQISLHSACS